MPQPFHHACEAHRASQSDGTTPLPPPDLPVWGLKWQESFCPNLSASLETDSLPIHPINGAEIFLRVVCAASKAWTGMPSIAPLSQRYVCQGSNFLIYLVGGIPACPRPSDSHKLPCYDRPLPNVRGVLSLFFWISGDLLDHLGKLILSVHQTQLACCHQYYGPGRYYVEMFKVSVDCITSNWRVHIATGQNSEWEPPSSLSEDKLLLKIPYWWLKKKVFGFTPRRVPKRNENTYL